MATPSYVVLNRQDVLFMQTDFLKASCGGG